MATAIYLEHYLDSIENLPCELQRNFTLMRELDNRAEEKKCEIDKLAEEYIKNVRNLAPDQRIQNGFSKCKEYSDDKVQLAMQTYEMVSNRLAIFRKFFVSVFYCKYDIPYFILCSEKCNCVEIVLLSKIFFFLTCSKNNFFVFYIQL
uniref:Inhibitor of growth family, member 5a n=1 Tax=Sinocyclocheilus rhinocerous TaxID=307959 RepID=A0A673N234_9TELE